MSNIIIVYNEPAPDALPDELDVLDQVMFIGDTLAELGHAVDRRGLTEDFFNEIAGLAAEKPDFVFNLAESAGGKAEVLYFIPALLNLYHLPYTGCPVEATFITASKVLARNMMKAGGIPVADGFSLSETGRLVIGTKYILKPIWEDGSVGINEDSVFVYDGTLPGIFMDKEPSHWFIEEFIEGREFNVSIIAGTGRPEVLPPAEMVFHDYPDSLPRIVSYKAKWDEDTFQYRNSRRSFSGEISSELRKNINDAVTGCWDLFRLKGYARVDLRVDGNENVYVLEVNANPCISPDSGFISAAHEAGLSDSVIVSRIIGDLNR